MAHPHIRGKLSLVGRRCRAAQISGLSGSSALPGSWRDSSFEITSKRRKGFPSETQVKRGLRIVHWLRELALSLKTTIPTFTNLSAVRNKPSVPGVNGTQNQGGYHGYQLRKDFQPS
jgi:hypothetical protein